jgi:SAM-dependent methyltransferase
MSASSSVRDRAIRTLRPILPARARLALRHVHRRADPLGIWWYRRGSGEQRPLPPRAIRERNAVDWVGYWYTAVDEATDPLLEMLERNDVRLAELERVLDFGCGAGKVIARLRGTGPELHGCDIHGPSIAWLGATYPDLHVRHTGFDPPLPYPGGHFDLLWAWSVLTHLDADRQAAWIREWARILRPGALLLATYNSAAQLERVSAGEGRDPQPGLERLERDGILFERYDQSGNFSADFAGTTEAYGNTYNTQASITTMLEESFELVELVPDAVWGAQDCAIARRR